MSRRNSLPGADWVNGFKSGWGYFANRQRTVRKWRNHREKSGSICCQLWPSIFRFWGYGNLLATTELNPPPRKTPSMILPTVFLHVSRFGELLRLWVGLGAGDTPRCPGPQTRIALSKRFPLRLTPQARVTRSFGRSPQDASCHSYRRRTTCVTLGI
jgi:hypothetical protein